MNKIVMALHNGRVDPLPRSCSEALTSNPSMESGIYDIDPDGSNVGDDPISVYCDVTTGKEGINCVIRFFFLFITHYILLLNVF